MKNSAWKIPGGGRGALLAVLPALALAGALLFLFFRGGAPAAGGGGDAAADRASARPRKNARDAGGGRRFSAGPAGGGAAAKPGGRKTAGKARRGATARSVPRRAGKKPVYDFVDSLPEKLKATAREMVRARDDGDEKGIVEPARALLASGIPEARLEAAEALGDAGWHGFRDTAGLLLDADEDVADAARNAWQMQMADLDDDGMRKEMMETVAETVANADSEYLEGVLNDYSVDNDDRKVLDFLVPLYAKTDSEPSKKVILDLIDSITLPDTPSKTIEDARPAIDEWYRDNPPDEPDEPDEPGEAVPAGPGGGTAAVPGRDTAAR